MLSTSRLYYSVSLTYRPTSLPPLVGHLSAFTMLRSVLLLLYQVPLYTVKSTLCHITHPPTIHTTPPWHKIIPSVAPAHPSSAIVRSIWPEIILPQWLALFSPQLSKALPSAFLTASSWAYHCNAVSCNYSMQYNATRNLVALRSRLLLEVLGPWKSGRFYTTRSPVGLFVLEISPANQPTKNTEIKKSEKALNNLVVLRLMDVW